MSSSIGHGNTNNSLPDRLDSISGGSFDHLEGGQRTDHLWKDMDDLSTADGPALVWVNQDSDSVSGYAAGHLVCLLPGNMCRVQLLKDQRVLEVPVGEIERANPPAFDQVGDVGDLRYLNECSITHTLLQRFGSGRIATYASCNSILCFNPMSPQLNIYGEPFMDLFTNCYHRNDMPPHVFSVAQLAMSRLNALARNARKSRFVRQQAICLLGRSGSGKSKAVLDILSYLVHQSDHVSSVAAAKKPVLSSGPLGGEQRLTVDHLRALFSLLDAFTCSRILLNTNASRAVRLFSLELVPSCERGKLLISGLTTRLFLVDTARVTDRPAPEPSLHIFYYLLSGLDPAVRNQLYLTDTDEGNIFMTPLQRPDDREAARKYWLQLTEDAQLLGFDLTTEWLGGGVARLLAIIYHLGCAGYYQHTDASTVPPGPAASSRPQICGFANEGAARRAAFLIGCSPDRLTETVFRAAQRSNSEAGGYHAWTAGDCLQAFVQTIYQVVVDILVMLINRALSSSSSLRSRCFRDSSPSCQLLLIDPPGFQAPGVNVSAAAGHGDGSVGCHSNSRTEDNPRSVSGPLSDLLFNYVNERLTHLFQTTTVDLQREWLKREKLPFPAGSDYSRGVADMLRFFHSDPQALHNKGYGGSGAHGLFSLLEKNAKSGSLNTFYSTLNDLYQATRRKYKNRDLRIIRRVRRNGAFVLNHSLSAFPVEYGPDSRWLANCLAFPTAHDAVSLLRQSSVLSVRRLLEIMIDYTDYLGPLEPPNLRSDGLGPLARAKAQMDYIVDILQSCARNNAGPSPDTNQSGFNDGGPISGLHWIHCLLPVLNAGLCQRISSLPQLHVTIPEHSDLLPVEASKAKDLVFSPARICVNLIRAQLRGLDLVTLLHVNRVNLPDRLSFTDFSMKYGSLISTERTTVSTHRETVQEVMRRLNYPEHSYLLGTETVFLQPTVLPQLKNLVGKGKVLTQQRFPHLVQLQAICRGYLARSRLSLLKAVAHARRQSTDLRDNGEKSGHAPSTAEEAICVSPKGSSPSGSHEDLLVKLPVSTWDLPRPSVDTLLDQVHLASTEMARSLAHQGGGKGASGVLVDGLIEQLMGVIGLARSLLSDRDRALNQWDEAERARCKATEDGKLLRIAHDEALGQLQALKESQGSQALADLQHIHKECTSKLTHLEVDLELARRDLATKDGALAKSRAEIEQLKREKSTKIETLTTTHENQANDGQKELTQEREQKDTDLGMAIVDLESRVRQESKLRSELKRYQTLLIEKESIVEQVLRQPSGQQETIRQLRDQVDRLDELNEKNMRVKRTLEEEIDDLQGQLATARRTSNDLDERVNSLKKENVELVIQVDEHQENANEAIRLRQTTLTELSIAEANIKAQEQEVNDLLTERDLLKAKIDELTEKVTHLESSFVPRQNLHRVESKLRETEQRLDMEVSSRARLQIALERSKETCDQLLSDKQRLITSEQAIRDSSRRLSRKLFDAQQEQEEASRRAAIAQRRASDAAASANTLRHSTSGRLSVPALRNPTVYGAGIIPEVEDNFEHGMAEEEIADWMKDSSCKKLFARRRVFSPENYKISSIHPVCRMRSTSLVNLPSHQSLIQQFRPSLPHVHSSHYHYRRCKSNQMLVSTRNRLLSTHQYISNQRSSIRNRQNKPDIPNIYRRTDSPPYPISSTETEEIYDVDDRFTPTGPREHRYPHRRMDACPIDLLISDAAVATQFIPQAAYSQPVYGSNNNGGAAIGHVRLAPNTAQPSPPPPPQPGGANYSLSEQETPPGPLSPCETHDAVINPDTSMPPVMSCMTKFLSSRRIILVREYPESTQLRQDVDPK